MGISYSAALAVELNRRRTSPVLQGGFKSWGEGWALFCEASLAYLARIREQKFKSGSVWAQANLQGAVGYLPRVDGLELSFGLHAFPWDMLTGVIPLPYGTAVY